MNANPTVLITGATDGIGLELARAYGQAGARLVLVGRRARVELDDELFTEATYCCADLAGKDAAGTVRDFLAARSIHSLDLLLHNAAVGQYGPIADEPPEVIANQVAVNLTAPVTLTHALAEPLERAGGKLVFISSVVESLPCADFAVYAATKAALDGFARSLRVEWRGRIEVQVIHPGAVKTGFHGKASVPPAQPRAEATSRSPSTDPSTDARRESAQTVRSESSVPNGFCV